MTGPGGSSLFPVSVPQARCEWPATVGSVLKCGNPSKARVLSPGKRWGREVCGIHRRSALARGWTAVAAVTPQQEALLHLWTTGVVVGWMLTHPDEAATWMEQAVERTRAILATVTEEPPG